MITNAHSQIENEMQALCIAFVSNWLRCYSILLYSSFFPAAHFLKTSSARLVANWWGYVQLPMNKL